MTTREPRATPDARRAPPLRARLGRAAALATLLALPLLPVPEFWITRLNDIGLCALVVLGLVLLTGVAGLTSFGQSAFVGLGAYASAYATTALGLSPWWGLAGGLALTLVVALVLAGITLRLSGHDLPLATIAWGLALFFLVGNLEFLGRFDGLQGLPPISLGPWPLRSARACYGLIWSCALGAAWALRNLLDSRPGRALRALDGGAAMAEAMGIATLRYKTAAFVIAALLAALSGWLFAHDQRSVNPSPFGLQMGIEYLLMAVLGGSGLVGGAFVGAGLVKIAEDQLQRVLPALLGTNGPVELVVFGIVLVGVLQRAPQGLWAWATSWWASWRASRGEIAPGGPHAPAREAGPRSSASLSRSSLQPSPASSALPSLPSLPCAARPVRGSLLLRARGLRKQFGGLVAVGDVGFDVQAGEIVGLIGPNGAGKSTLFNLLSGVLAPGAGRIDWRGQRIDGLPARAIARLGISRTFQHVRLVARMSVLENVALGAHRRGRAGVLRALLRLDRAEERRLFAEAWRQLARVGLAGLALEPAGQLALGQQRLLEIARALCTDPALLLLDEPAAGLRLQEKQALTGVLAQLRAEGLSLLLVEHDMDFVMTLADRIVVLDAGIQLMDGTPQAVRDDPAVRAAYLGSAP